MKKILSMLLVCVLIFSCFAMVAGGDAPQTVTMYAPDGRTLQIDPSEVEAYKNVGWFETYEEVTATMFAPDGRTIVIYVAQIPDYIRVGWYETYEEVTRTLYAPDGRTILIYMAEIPAYEAVGWYQYPPNRKMVALTFDDGPSYYTDTILDALSSHGAKATFFVVGQRVPSYPNQLRRAASLGMEIGNHTQSHQSLTSLSYSGISQELGRCDAAVANILSYEPWIFRPPYGNCNTSIAKHSGMPAIMWSLDTLDWKTRNTTSIVNAVLSHVKDGDIILMHDIYPTTAQAVVQLIPALQQRGYQLVTVSELAAAKGGGLNPGSTYYHF